MTFDDWKEKQEWLDPVPDDLSITDLHAAWKAAKQDSLKILQPYQQAINKIDDYFEYRFRSHSKEENKQFVSEVLNEITRKLATEN